MMNSDEEPRAESSRERVLAHRARQIAAGRVAVYLHLPGDLVEAVDRLKAERRVSSRAPIIEEAIRLYMKKEEGMK